LLVSIEVGIVFAGFCIISSTADQKKH
jgi:hypothetical protein